MDKFKNICLSVILFGVSAAAIYAAGKSLSSFKLLNDTVNEIEELNLLSQIKDISRLMEERKNVV